MTLVSVVRFGEDDKKYDGLDEAFNVETEIVSAEKESIEVAKVEQKSDVDKDYEYTRGNLYSIIEKVKRQSMVFLS